MSKNLFDDSDSQPWIENLTPDIVLLHHFALAEAKQLLKDIHWVLAQAPLQSMFTPGGKAMSVMTSSCGDAGWVTDRRGYRYSSINPASGKSWPAMPERLRKLGEKAANEAGFSHFLPDSCLINYYEPGAKMSLHQDKDEKDFSQPIVSVSLGLPIIFLLGGMQRSDKALRLPLEHGDVLIWGREDRLRFHGVMPLAEGSHEVVGNCRINLTFRKAL